MSCRYNSSATRACSRGSDTNHTNKSRRKSKTYCVRNNFSRMVFIPTREHFPQHRPVELDPHVYRAQQEKGVEVRASHETPAGPVEATVNIQGS